MGLRDLILDALPQTQCTRCGYPDCAAYADAVVTGEAAINQCPPGGQQGVARLARLTGQPETPLNPEFGHEGPRHVAWIDEAWCIGCTLCLPVCPTDAILGAHKRMHTVIESECTGCELCIPVCPVDCIHLSDVSSPATGWQAWSPLQAQHARERYASHQQRLARTQAERAERQVSKLSQGLQDLNEAREAEADAQAERKRSLVAAALARAQARTQG